MGPHPTPEQIKKAREHQAERKRNYLEHPEHARSITVHARTITVYSARCLAPDCGWQRTNRFSLEILEAEMQSHIMQCDRIAAQWAVVDPNEAYVEP
jgi:hypothetical protein